MEKKKIKFLCVIVFIIILILLLVQILLKVVSGKNEANLPTAITIELDENSEKKLQKTEDKSIKEKLSKLSETKRIEYYVTEFIKAIENRQCKTAYEMLNDEFKNNYFATLESFEAYVDKYMPKNIGTKYKNIERLGEIYVMEIDINDVLTRKDPNNFSGYIVVKENDYNEFELSFSVDSAMKKDSQQETEE